MKNVYPQGVVLKKTLGGNYIARIVVSRSGGLVAVVGDMGRDEGAQGCGSGNLLIRDTQPPRITTNPRHRATVGSYGVYVSYERGTPAGVGDMGRDKGTQGCGSGLLWRPKRDGLLSIPTEKFERKKQREKERQRERESEGGCARVSRFCVCVPERERERERREVGPQEHGLPCVLISSLTTFF